MKHLPRFAVGTIQPRASRDPVVWALVSALAEMGESPVLFRSSFELSCLDPSQAILGRASRHLDSWAMSRSDAISALARGTAANETAMVAGPFDAAQPKVGPRSSLNRLCEWLDLPRIAVVDVRDLAHQGIQRRGAKIDGLILDRVSDSYDAAYWQTTLEAMWKAPVIGWLGEESSLRTHCTTVPACGKPSRELCAALGRRLAPTLRLGLLSQLADRSAPLSFEPEPWLTRVDRLFRIAVAIDEAYCGYYPETLDLLEAAGAELCDFSPLRSEAIPENVDVVYFGCGHPERAADTLAANHCLKQSLRTFAAAGGRIYAEGSGLAYLCREIVMPCGRTIAMTGLLPASAHWLGPAACLEPAEVTFATSSWLAPATVSLRGYRHSGWKIEPRAPVIPYAIDGQQQLDMLGRGNVIGSRVLVNLAANRHLLRLFFEPYAPATVAARRHF